MYAEDLRRDNGSNGKAVEHVYECLPRLDITPPLAFIIKPVHCGERIRTARRIQIARPHLVSHWHIRGFLVRGRSSRDT